jgi:ComF family protein
MNFLSEFLDFLSPRFCLSCNSKVSTSDIFICPNCFSSISKLTEDELKVEFNRKFSSTGYIDDYTSLFNFEEEGTLQELIHQLKYNNKFRIGNFLGSLLAKEKKEILQSWNADLIIPIPLFHLKKVERGYNQADYIAKGLSKQLKIKFSTSVSKRVKNTISQTKLTSLERKNNMQNAFKIKRPKLLIGKNIIIVDDVITTGTTVLELAKILKENGAAKVYSLSVATPLISHTFRG